MTRDELDQRLPELRDAAVDAARRVLGRRDIAEDAAQDAMAKLFEHHRRLDAKKVEGWVRVVAARKAIDIGVKENKEVRLGPPPMAAESAPSQWQQVLHQVTSVSPTDAAAYRQAVDAALALLPARSAEALRYWLDGLSDEEAAQRADTTPGAMRKRQTDARKALRPLLPDDVDWLARNPFRP